MSPSFHHVSALKVVQGIGHRHRLNTVDSGREGRKDSRGHDEAEETLEIDKPLDFTKKDTHSFSEWLKLTKANPIDRSKSEEKPLPSTEDKEAFSEEIDQGNRSSDQERKFKMIEKFIQDKPKIKPAEQQTTKANLAKPYTQTQEALKTETLAKVYLQQKNYKKAIQAYKILILKNPEKSGFFADQISAIEKIIDTQ